MNPSNLTSAPQHSSSIAQTSARLAVVFTAYVVVIALCFLHLRSWDGVILRQVVTIASYPLFFFGVVALGMQMTSERAAPPLANVWVLPLGSLLFMGLPFGLNQLGAWAVLPVAMVGLGLTLWALGRSHRGGGWLRLLWLPLPGLIIALVYFAVVNGSGYAHLFADVAAYNGTLHRDTLFHAAIINMLAHFSTPSTGLDGVQPLAYHVGVHRWLAGSQGLAPGHAPMLLAIGMQVALLPAVFFAWALAISLLLRRPIGLLFLLGLAFGSLLTLGCFVWDPYLLSESYAFSLPVFFAVAPVGQRWVGVGSHGKRAPSFWGLTVAVVAAVACTAAKVSTGVMLGLFLTGCGLLPRLLQRDQRSLLLYGAAGLLFCTAGVGLAYVALGAPALMLSPFHFVRSFPRVFVNSIWVAGLCLGLFYAWSSRQDDPSSHRPALTLALGGTFLASLVPGLLLDIDGGATYYFTHPAQLLLLLFAMAGLIDRRCWTDLRTHVALDHPLTKTTVLSASGRLVLLGIAGVVIAQLALPLSNPGIRAKSFINHAAHTLSGATDEGTVSLTNQGSPLTLSKTEKLALLWDPPELAARQASSGLSLVEEQLAAAGVIPAAGDAIVYISPDVRTFWTLEQARTCWDKSFDVPAMVGLPLLNGVRGKANDCETTSYYGMADYGSSSLNMAMSNDQLCRKASKLGFAKVLAIGKNDQPLLSC